MSNTYNLPPFYSHQAHLQTNQPSRTGSTRDIRARDGRRRGVIHLQRNPQRPLRSSFPTASYHIKDCRLLGLQDHLQANQPSRTGSTRDIRARDGRRRGVIHLQAMRRGVFLSQVSVWSPLWSSPSIPRAADALYGLRRKCLSYLSPGPLSRGYPPSSHEARGDFLSQVSVWSPLWSSPSIPRAAEPFMVFAENTYITA